MATKIDMSTIRPIMLLELALVAVFIAVLVKSILPVLSAKRVILGPTNIDRQDLPVINANGFDTSILSTFDPFNRSA